MFIDSLYGNIDISIDNRIISSAEVQRLRGIRLCNINSPYITGSDTLNRFEHAIGTAYLAEVLCSKLDVSKDEKFAFLLAALCHDVVTAPFGHSLEYLFESIKSVEYEHANIWKMFLTGKSIPTSRNIYFGKKQELQRNIVSKIMDIVISILQREHFLGQYLDNNIDIDNIDNVFRFAFHIGIQFDKATPVALASSLKYKDNQLILDSNSIPLVQEWFNVRERLYKYLLENQGEFVAKALLERCFIEGVKYDIINENDWILTDSDMANKLFSEGTPTIKKTIQNLMFMEFPQYSRIYYSNDYKIIDTILKNEKISLIESAYKAGVYLHFIRDVNKTRRPIDCRVVNNESLSDIIRVGNSDDRYLIGLFSDSIKSIDIILNELKQACNAEFLLLRNESDQTQISLF